MYVEANSVGGNIKPRAVTSKRDPDIRYKVTLLRHFARYMDANLVPASDVINNAVAPATAVTSSPVTKKKQQTSSSKVSNDLHLRGWWRNNEALVMMLHDGTIQVITCFIHVEVKVTIVAKVKHVHMLG